jgi:outer membrane protein TolC
MTSKLAAQERYMVTQQRSLGLARGATTRVWTLLQVLTPQQSLYAAQLASARLNRLTALVNLNESLGVGRSRKAEAQRLRLVWPLLRLPLVLYVKVAMSGR